MTKFVLFRNVQPGQMVDDGFGGYKTAPSEPGTYRLVEWADEDNQHIRFEWEHESESKRFNAIGNAIKEGMLEGWKDDPEN